MPPRAATAGTSPSPAKSNHSYSPLATYMGWLLLALAAALYYATLDTGLTPSELKVGDLITHQYAQVQARPSNAPGYPLYTMGGWLWFHGARSILALLGNPLPNPMPILSSYSTVWALLSLWLFYRILLHLSRSADSPHGNWPLAWTISAFYAVTFSFWYYATTTEQYCSAVAHTLALVYLYLLWEDATKRMKMTTRRNSGVNGVTRLLLVMAFLCGLALAHLVTVAVIVPPLLLAILWRQPRLLHRPRLMLGAVLSAGAPLISYLYIYLRGAAHPEWRGQGDWATTQEWFWSFVSTAQGREELSWGLQPGAPFSGKWLPTTDPAGAEPADSAVGAGRYCLVSSAHAFADVGHANLLSGVMLGGPLRQLVPGDHAGLSACASRPSALGSACPKAPCTDDAIALARRSQVFRFRTFVPILVLLGATAWNLAASWSVADHRGRPEDTALARPALLLFQRLPADIGLFGGVFRRFGAGLLGLYLGHPF